jgi:hypothetical protein
MLYAQGGTLMSSKIERRNATRYIVPLYAWTEEGMESEEKLVDMSESGCGFASPVDFSSNEHVVVHFGTPKGKRLNIEKFCLHGTIVWKKKDSTSSFRYGLTFPAGTSSFFNEQLVFACKTMKDMEKKGLLQPAV